MARRKVKPRLRLALTSGQASDWGRVRTRPGGAGSPMEEPVHRLFIPLPSRRKTRAPTEGCVGSKTADGSPLMVGAISGGRPGRVETMTAPPLGTGVEVGRPKRGATAVTPPPVGGDSMHSGAPRKCRRIGQKMEGVEPRPFPQVHAGWAHLGVGVVGATRRTIAVLHPAPPELGSNSAWWECRTSRRVRGGCIRLYRLFGENSGPPAILECRRQEGQSNCNRGSPGGGVLAS